LNNRGSVAVQTDSGRLFQCVRPLTENIIRPTQCSSVVCHSQCHLMSGATDDDFFKEK